MSFWNLFLITFLLGLGGAISPGALLTYTIYRSIKQPKQSIKTGLKISFGHVTVELVLMIFLLAGVLNWVKNPKVIIVIGFVGGILLIYFGTTILYQIARKKVDTQFLIAKRDNITLEEDDKKKKFPYNKKLNAYFASMGFLMSNPYWWLWWITIGTSIMLDNGVLWGNWSAFIIFVIAKELGAIIWYTGVSVAVGLARKIMTHGIYLAILAICGLFMLVYGIYLGISPLLSL